MIVKNIIFDLINHRKLNMERLLFLFLICIFSSTLFAAEKVGIKGVWQGTIANQAVIAVFDGGDDGYFYLKYLKPITLQAQSPELNYWLEKADGKNVANWQLTNVTQDKITGTWHSLKGNKREHIKLTRIDSIPEGDLLSVYQLAKAFQQKIHLGKTQEIGKRQYRVLASNHQQTLELIGGAPNIEQLNYMLKIGLYMQVSNYYGCPSPAEMGRGAGVERDYQSRVDIKFWSSDWIVFEEVVSGDCGGAYPFVDFSRRTVNLSTLKSIQLWTWFKSSKKPDALKEFETYYFNYMPPPKLMKIIAERAYKQRQKLGMNSGGEEDGCLKEGLSIYQTDYSVSIGETGLVFSTHFPHVIQACDEEVEIDYNELLPYLNNEGKRQVLRLLANR